MDTDVEVALLKAIRAEPDDDLPRLVYADLLREDGKDSWADFVQGQIEGFAVPFPQDMLAAWHPEMLAGMSRKVRSHGKGEWAEVTFTPSGPGAAVMRPGLTLVWRRGFIDEVQGPLSWARGVVERLVGRHPVRVVDAVDREPWRGRLGDLGLVRFLWDDGVVFQGFFTDMPGPPIPSDLAEAIEPEILLGRMKCFSTEKAARRALSKAVLKLARGVDG